MNQAAEQLRAIATPAVRPVGFGSAAELVKDVGPRTYLHAGPPIRPSDTVGAMRGALIGALMLEGEAQSPEAAEAIIAGDDLQISPCHDSGGVGALAGVVSPSTPVVVVEREGGPTAFATTIEGLGAALSFGNYDPTTLNKVRWLAGMFSECLNEALALAEPIDIIDVQAKGLRRGDEGHNRIVSSTEMLVARLAPAFLTLGPRSRSVLNELVGNPHFFLTLSIAAAKAVAMAIEERGPAGIVTAMSGNGVVTGFKVSGSPRWYIGDPVLPTSMMVIPGRSVEDAGALMGDSGITETVGLGAFSLTSSPGLARVLGLDVAASQQVVDEMREICIADHPRYQLPADDFRGSPFGISVKRVAETGITPAVNAGYAHRTPGEGRVGANLARFPLSPLLEAAEETSGPGGR